MNATSNHQLGLSHHPGTPAFLKRAFGISFEGQVSDMPLYRDTSGKLFWGGWGSFYTVCMDEKEILQSEAEMLGQRYGLIETCFSTQRDFFGARQLHLMLTIPHGTKEGERMSLYDGKTRNQTRRAREAPLTLTLQKGRIPTGWYELYVDTMQRLNAKPKEAEYFNALAECFGDSMHVVLAHDGTVLVGSTLYITHGTYVHLLSNISRESHWPMRVNNLVYDEMVRLCVTQDVHYLDYGLTALSEASHLTFKEGFGGERRYIAAKTFGTLGRRLLAFGGRLKRAVLRRFVG